MNTSTTMTEPQYVHLARKPKSSYRQLFVRGTRISARALYGEHMAAEMTPEEIAHNYDLPVEAVREAIAYCESDPVELREDYAMEERLMEATGMNEPGYKDNPFPRLLTAQERAALADG